MRDDHVCIKIIDEIGLRIRLEQQVLDEVGLAVVQMPGARDLDEPELHGRGDGIGAQLRISRKSLKPIRALPAKADYDGSFEAGPHQGVD
jgi:hypothetical protein